MIFRGLSSATRWHIPGIRKRKVSGVVVWEPERVFEKNYIIRILQILQKFLEQIASPISKKIKSIIEILLPCCPELLIWPKIENRCRAFSQNWDLPSFCRLFRAVSGVKLLPSLPRPGKTLNLLIFCASNVSLANPKMNGTISYTSSRRAWVRYR